VSGCHPFNVRSLAATLALSVAPIATQAYAQVPATPFDPVTVTATKTERSRDDVPATINVVGPEEIERRAPTKVDDLIRDIPGVDMSGGPRRSAQDINIRGFGGQRVVTTIDGARQNFEAGHKGRVYMDPDLLKQVEVLKGPASTLYGSGAIGGVLAMTTKDAADYLDGATGYMLRGKVGYSSAARERLTGVTQAGKPVEQFDYVANLTYRDGSNIQQGGGRELASSATDTHSGLFKVGINPVENHRIGMSYQFMHERGDMPNLSDENITSSAPGVHRSIDTQTTNFSYGFKSPENTWLNPTVRAYQTKVNIKDDRLQSSPSPGNTPRFDRTDFLTTGFDLFNTSRFDTGFGQHAITYGTEYFMNDAVAYRNGNPRPEFPRGRQDVLGFYVQDEITMGAVSVTPGIRYDKFDASSAGFKENSESDVSPRLGAVWRVTHWASLFASYAEGFRAPTLLELFVSGAHIPGQVNFISNPDLKPEKTETYEAGPRFKFENVLMERDKLRLAGTYFTTEASDFIELTGSVPPSTGARYVNIPTVNVDGVELEAMYDTPRMFAGAGYARIRGTNESTGGGVNSIPPDKLTLTAGGKAPTYDLIYGARSEIADRQDRIGDLGTKTGGYAIHGVFASWLPSTGILNGMRVDVGIDNIFDKAYRRHLTALYDEGRDYHGAVSYTLKF
jgi:hemoglobin/transferrin/lactoferrin receptor protein